MIKLCVCVCVSIPGPSQGGNGSTPGPDLVVETRGSGCPRIGHETLSKQLEALNFGQVNHTTGGVALLSE